MFKCKNEKDCAIHKSFEQNWCYTVLFTHMRCKPFMSIEKEAFIIIPGQSFSGLMLLEFLVLHKFNRSLTIDTAQTTFTQNNFV